MPLSINQFNKLATKDELKELKKEMLSKKEYNKIMNTLDGISKDVKDIKSEKTANLGAHLRIQEDVNEIRSHVGMPIKHRI